MMTTQFAQSLLTPESTVVAIDVGTACVDALAGGVTVNSEDARRYTSSSDVVLLREDSLHAKHWGQRIPEVVKIADKRYLCGNDALAVASTDNDLFDTRQENWLDTESALALIYSTLHEFDVSGDVHLALGLPTAVYPDLADSISERLAGQHEIRVGEAEREVHLTVHVLPHAAAAARHLLYRNDPGTQAALGIIDVGFNTADFLSCHFGEEEILFFDGKSGTYRFGLADVLDAFRLDDVENFGRSPDRLASDHLLREQTLPHRGGEVDMRLYLGGLVRCEAEPLIQELKRFWPDAAGMTIYVVGGGAELLQPVIKDRLKARVIVPHEHSWSVALGSYKELVL